MAISLASLKRTTSVKAMRAILYGVHGVGKTTAATSAPSPVVVQTEDGLGTIDVPHFPLAATFDDVLEAFTALYDEAHDFKTVIIDSIDWLEQLVWKKTCQVNKWNSIEDAGYGKGYIAALDLWRVYIDAINALRDERGMAIIQIAHADIKRFDSPEHEPYDRYQIKLHQRASALLQEHADCVFFLNYRISTVKTDVGFNKKVTRAVGGGNRVLYCEERPAFLAKNRYNMPDSIVIPDDPANAWSAVSQFLPQVTD